MKIYSLLIIAVIFLFTGCGNKQPVPDPQPNIVVETTEVTTMGKTKAKHPKCEFEGQGMEPRVKLLECVVILKRFINTYIVDIKDE